MVAITSPETASLARILAMYNPHNTIARTAGLLTVPEFQANTIRLEVLAHLAVVHCAGKEKPGHVELGRWLNKHLGRGEMAMLEDPVEDVFISNVCIPEGNRRIFEGIWESNDYFLQLVLDTLMHPRVQRECQNLLPPVFALLQLSECVADRLSLYRWHIEASIPKNFVRLDKATRVGDRARAVTFTNEDLKLLGITRETLAPFILRMENKRAIIGEYIGHSSLERHPLVDFGDTLIFALLPAASPAIRRFVLSELRQTGYLQEFRSVLESLQARQIEMEGLSELKGDTVSLSPPPPEQERPPALHSWLLRYDSNKYLHVVLLHDQLDSLVEEGLSSFMKYPEEMRLGLEKYLNRVARHCQALSDCDEGTTLLVMAGLGRGFMLDFKDWPDGWRLSIIRISDLFMLAGEIGEPVKRYLKCMKQKEWAKDKVVYFLNFNGDYNFYCYWRHLNCQLIPRGLSVNDGSIISIDNDFVLHIRQELRGLIDRHVVQTAAGPFVQVIRFGMDAYFKSMHGRPIYASLDHVRNGILAGAVETSRGPTWLVIDSREGDESFRHLLYEIWSGFVGLYDRLVTETEALMSDLSHRPVEIRLNFRELKMPHVSTETCTSIVEPEIIIHLDQGIAEIKFPPDFLMHFQQPDNTGERLVLLTLARGLVGVHRGLDEDVEDAFLETILTKVIGDPGMRIMHMFHTYSPIEHLLSRQKQKPVFLAHEDFVFAKLRLSEGCTPVKSEASLMTKIECNDFLHKVVTKIWGQLRDILRQFDRTSVIRQALAVHESVLQDRDLWRRTAQAVIALYSPAENVFAVAQTQEEKRNQVALPARTILEMAICECPTSGGNQLSRWGLDEILAKAALLIEAATDSDAINSELVEPTVQLHANGEYTIDRRFHETVIRPFVSNNLREEYQGYASAYSKFYRRRTPAERTRADETYSADFVRAFTMEFGLTPDEAIDGLQELMELAVECDSVVVQTTFGKLRERLLNKRSLSADACHAFVKTYGLFHRPAWDHPPAGFMKKDLYPWRFRRRLSAMVRPLLVFGEQDRDEVFYGAGTLQLGFSYLLERTEQGQLPGKEFFATKQMRTYIGKVNEERGRAFTESVADMLRKRGWQARSEVQMTEIGASAELGDIDVIGWKSTGEILLIECKRLQLARTIAEIAEVCSRFKGEAKDDLDKHLRRIAWVNQHTSNLKRIVGFTPDKDHIDARLVTNVDVPMRYLMSLPIAVDKIGPLRHL